MGIGEGLQGEPGWGCHANPCTGSSVAHDCQMRMPKIKVGAVDALQLHASLVRDVASADLQLARGTSVGRACQHMRSQLPDR